MDKLRKILQWAAPLLCVGIPTTLTWVFLGVSVLVSFGKFLLVVYGAIIAVALFIVVVAALSAFWEWLYD